MHRKKFCQFRKKLTLCRNAEVARFLFVNPSYPNSSKDIYEVLVEKKISQFYHACMTQYCCNWDFCVVGCKKKCQTDINQISTLNLRSLLSMLTDFRFYINQFWKQIKVGTCSNWHTIRLLRTITRGLYVFTPFFRAINQEQSILETSLCTKQGKWSLKSAVDNREQVILVLLK